MVSRAHAAHHYSFGGAARPRGGVRVRDDEPVILPRSSNWDVNSVLLAAALASIGIVSASAYVIFNEPQVMAETPTLSLTRDLPSDADVTKAHVLKALSGPAFAVPSSDAPVSVDVSDEPAAAEPSATPEPRQDSIIDDSAPGAQERFPQSSPATPPLKAPFPEPARPPNPDSTTTPPDGFAPPNTSPETPTPALDPENPYR